MSRPTPNEITHLLQAWRAGSSQAEEQLWPVVYQELKALARGVLRRHGGRSKAGATTLVHEAYLRLVGADSMVDWNDRGHFFAVAARAMRFILVDEARRRMSKKREGEDTRAEIPEGLAVGSSRSPEELLAVHEALDRLAKISPRQEKLVEMRYFAGFSIDEAAEALAVSRPTVVRDWRAIKIWLYGELKRVDVAN